MKRIIRWIWLPLVAVAAGATARSVNAASAASCTNGGDCDIRRSGTILRPAIWGGECTWDALQKRLFDSTQYTYPTTANGLAPGLTAPPAFLTGVCEMERAGGSVDRGIAQLEEAQRQPLMPAQKQAAQLFEGVMHCRKMRAIQASFAASPAAFHANDRARAEFCAHRSMAKATFNRMHWSGISLSYDGSPAAVSDRLAEVATCSSAYLHSGYDADCGVVSAMDAKTRDDRIGAAADVVIGEMFGLDGAAAPPPSAGTPTPVAVPNPLRTLVRGRVVTTQQAFDGLTKTVIPNLTTRFAALGVGIDALGKQFTASPGSLYQRSESAAARYDATVADAQDILAFVDKWFNGLYEDANKVNVADSVATNVARLDQALHTNGHELTMPQKLASIEQTFDSLLGAGQTDNVYARRLCAIYFCELVSRDDVTDVCNSYDDVLNMPYSQANPLCTSGGKQAAATLCTKAGFADLHASDADACVRKY